VEAPLKSSAKTTRSKAVNKSPAVPGIELGSTIGLSEPSNANATNSASIPNLLDGSQDSGGDDSLDLISKNPEITPEALKDIVEKTSIPPEQELSKEKDHIWSKIKSAQAEGDDILARALLTAYDAMDTSKPTLAPRSISARPVLTVSDHQSLATTATVTESEDNLIYAVGAVTSHQDIGFTPYFDENIKKLRAPIPLTIFDKEWQKKALTAHMLLKPAKSSEDKAYRGLAYHDEWTQTHSAWTNNHRSFFITLRDVYNKSIFANKLLIHKANCDAIADVYGFMTAFRYDMQIRMNAFAHRLPSKDGAAIPDIAVKQDVVIEQCYSIVRSHGETGWKDNHYAPGGSHSQFDPDTGCKKPDLLRSVSAPNYQGGNRQQTQFNHYNNMYGSGNHQERRRENNRNRHGGNSNNSYHYNQNYEDNFQPRFTQYPTNFNGNYEHHHQPYGGTYHHAGNDGRKRFRGGGSRLEANDKPSGGGAASISKT
jgi:hypothetical protein